MRSTLIFAALLFGFSAFATDTTLFRTEQFISNDMTCEIGAVDSGTFGTGHYFDWGRGQNGWGYCYEWAGNGAVLNGGQPVSYWNCEQNRPSHFSWARGQNGWGYCYQFTPYGVAMNEGTPQSHWNCEQTAPSRYTWGRSHDGNTYCYQISPNGYYLNEGNPVSNSYCY